MRLLLIDDDPQIIRLVRFALSAESAEVVSFTDAAEGLAAAARERFDGLLLDVMMPNADGRATLAALRDSAASRDLPVIFMTAKSRADEIAELRRLGAADVIRKPFDPATLPAEIRRILGGAKNSSDAVPPIPLAMRRGFVASAVDRLDAIERSLEILAVDASSRNELESLRMHFHRLAGVATSYGFQPLSDTARGEERLAEQLLDKNSGVGRDIITGWTETLCRLREQLGAAGPDLMEPVVAPARRPTRLLCVDAESGPERFLGVLAFDSAFAVESAHSAGDAERALERGLADVIVVAADLPNASALDLIAGIRARPHGTRPAVFLDVRRRPTIAEIRRAEELAVDGFLDTRIVDATVARIRTAVDRKSGPTPRLLFAGIAQYADSFASVIESAGYQLRITDDLEHLDVDVARFDADMILAGVEGNSAEAVRLARAVHMVIEPASCPIAIVTGTAGPGLHVQARRAGIDVLEVPLSRALLLSTIESRVAAARAWKAAMHRDPLTACFRETSFRERLQQRLNDRSSGGELTLAVAEVEDPLALALADLLRTHLRDTDEIARLTGGRFAVAMERISALNATTLLDNLAGIFSAMHGAPLRFAVTLVTPDLSAEACIARATLALHVDRPAGSGAAVQRVGSPATLPTPPLP